MKNNELLEQAKAAQSPEELLKLAHENGMTDFTAENAIEYYAMMHRSGEISDDELENAAGGCKSHNRRIVTTGLICPGNMEWKCEKCLRPVGACGCGWLPVSSISRPFKSSIIPYCSETCGTCAWCSKESGVWYCNNAEVNAKY